MKIEQHVAKWERFDALRADFDPLDDFEMWYWMALSGATALINAALHVTGLTEENRCFPTQVPDVYVVMHDDGSSSHQIRFRCDLIHVGLPELSDPIPRALQSAFAAAHVLETYRDPCVRADGPINEGVVAACEAAYQECVRVAASVIHSSYDGHHAS